MIISYFGKEFFKISQGDLVIALNPVSKDSSHKDKISKFGSSIALITANHADYNGVENVTYGETAPFVISGPGDFEIKDIYVRGLLTNTEIGKNKYINTIYNFTIDDIKICFLGALSKDILSNVREAIGTPDILFVPIGGGDVLDFKEAYKISLSLEPKIIIPMDYGEDRQKDALKNFLKEGGSDKVEPIEKLTLKKKDLEGKDGEIVVLKQ